MIGSYSSYYNIIVICIAMTLSKQVKYYISFCGKLPEIEKNQKSFTTFITRPPVLRQMRFQMQFLRSFWLI